MRAGTPILKAGEGHSPVVMWGNPFSYHVETGLEGQEQKATEGTATGLGRDQSGLAWSGGREESSASSVQLLVTLGKAAVRGLGPVHLSTKCHLV